MAANIAIRTAPSSGLIVFVNHAYAAQAHQSTPSTSSPFTSPAQVGSSTTSPVTCVIAKTKMRSKKSSSGVTRSSAALPWFRAWTLTGQAYPSVLRVLRAAGSAAALSGLPSTVHALATGRDPLEAACAAGAILLPHETGQARLLAAAVPVHLGLSLFWTIVLDRAGVRGAWRGAVAGLAIAALDLELVGRRFPRIRALPRAPQLADHAAFGAIAARLLDA